MVVGGRLVAATAAKHELRGVELHTGTGALRDVTQPGLLFLLPNPSYPHADSKLEGKH